MAKGTVTLSRRMGGSYVLPVLKAKPEKTTQEVAVTTSSQKLALTADNDDQIWEFAFDVNVRVLFGTNPTVTAATGRLLFAGIPYTYSAESGQMVAVIQA